MQDHKDQEFLGVISGVTEWEFLSKLSKINVKVCRIRDIKMIITLLIVSSMHRRSKFSKNYCNWVTKFMLKLKMLIWLKKQLDFNFLRH
jgi:hypothetical protein